MNTIEEAARRLAQQRSSDVDTPSEPAPAQAAPVEVGSGEPPAPRQISYVTLTQPSGPPAKQSPQAAARPEPQIERMGSEQSRMAPSLLLSLLIHGLLLSLTFGGQGLGLPSLGFPWQQRRVEVPELRVSLVPAPATPAVVNPVATPAQPASTEPPRARGSAPTPQASPAPLARRALEVAPSAELELNAVAPGVSDSANSSTRSDEPRKAVRPKVADTPAINARPSGRQRRLVAPPVPTGPDVITAAPGASSPETVMPAHQDASDRAPERIGQDVAERAAALAKQADQLEAARVATRREADQREEAARVEAARVETARAEAARAEVARVDAARAEAKGEEAAQLAASRLEAEREEAARQEAAARIEAARRAAAQLEAERLRATREEAARVEAARAAQLEAERQEAARKEMTARIEATRRAEEQLEAQRRPVRQEAAPVEPAQTARPDAQRQEPARQETARPQAARPEAERQEPTRQPAAAQDVARGEAEKEQEKREARLRVIGRQLDEEAAQREAASNAARQLPLSLSTARRARLWGRVDPNVELVQYAEAWARKIQFNTPVATVRELAKQPHRHPMVTVAIRSDGSVESVTFVVSSGVAQVDDAIRHIVQSHQHYPAFSPALAREYDVIEIRRTWHFDDAVRLQ